MEVTVLIDLIAYAKHQFGDRVEGLLYRERRNGDRIDGRRDTDFVSYL